MENAIAINRTAKRKALRARWFLRRNQENQAKRAMRKYFNLKKLRKKQAGKVLLILIC
jgi:hypothetical protein